MSPRKKTTPAKKKAPAPKGERLQKVLASAGFGSRRKCEELIEHGRVEVDKRTILELGTRVDAQTQEIRVDGNRVHIQRRVYFMLNKPTGVVTTNSDPSGRTRVIDLIDTRERLFSIGRLDRTSEGLLLLTNDGDLANRLAHPRYGIEKTYHVEVDGQPTIDVIAQLRKGVHLAEAFVRVDRVKIKRRTKNGAVLEMILSEGRNREIRRVLAKIGHKVRTLRRVAMGPVRLGEMPVGAYRELTREEVRKLQTASSSGAKKKKAAKPKPAPKISSERKELAEHSRTEPARRKKVAAKKAHSRTEGGRSARQKGPVKKKTTVGRKKVARKGVKKGVKKPMTKGAGRGVKKSTGRGRGK